MHHLEGALDTARTPHFDRKELDYTGAGLQPEAIYMPSKHAKGNWTPV